MEKITVKVPQDLMIFIPAYLESRRSDVKKISAAIQNGDFEVIAYAGHRMRGTGRGYGFDQISLLGAALEDAAEKNDILTITAKLADLSRYLEHVQIEAA